MSTMPNYPKRRPLARLTVFRPDALALYSPTEVQRVTIGTLARGPLRHLAHRVKGVDDRVRRWDV